MITCKEDLLNTYIENDFGELRDLYLAKCEDFGLKTGADRLLQDGTFDHYDSECFEVLYDGKVYFPNFKNLSQNSRKLTLADLKPRTKESTAVDTLSRMGYEWHGGELWKPPIGKPRFEVVYEKITESIFDLKDEFERGELYWWYESDCKDKSEYIDISSEYDLMTYTKDGNLFRKVVKEIDWQTLVSEYVRENNCNDAQPGESFDVDGLVLMDDDFLEMCRVALRATGELK